MPTRRELHAELRHCASDVTERKRTTEEIERLVQFSSESPIPVLCVSKTGSVLYANEASSNLLKVWGCGEGKKVPDHWCNLISEALGTEKPQNSEVECEDTVYLFTFAPVKKAGFVHVYGINITERKQIEEALEEREKHFRLFSMSTGDCFWNWDMVLGTVDRSSGFERTFGYTPEEILPGIEWWVERIHPEDKERVRKTFDTALAGTQTACAYEYRFRCQDGSYAVIDDRVCLIRDASGKVVRSLGAMRDITGRRQAEQQILENQAQLKSLASALVQAEERERNRLAVHLHDGVCQSLAYAKMKLQMVNAALDDPTQRDALEEISDTLTQIMQEVRTLTFELSSPVLREFGLEAAIAQWLKEQIEQKHGIATEFTDGGQAKPLAEDIRALLFRCVRELLANVVKHSQAKRVRVSISRAAHQIVICLEDDGVGFDPDKVEVGKDAGGFGLFSIREQLSQLSGSLKIDSGPSQGCRSILRAPLLPSSLNGRRTP